MADTRSREEWGIRGAPNTNLTHKLVAASAISPNRFVVVNAAGKVAQAGASAINVVGVAPVGGATGDTVEIETAHIVIVEGDGAVAAGDLVASDANGRATTIAGAAVVGTIAAAWLILGVALETDGAAGDTIKVKMFR